MTDYIHDTDIMYKIVYIIRPEQKDTEINWLRDQMVFPSSTVVYDVHTLEYKIWIGAIVDESMALSIKLRHIVYSQEIYKQR